MKHKYLPHDPVGHVRQIIVQLEAIQSGPPVRTRPLDPEKEEAARQAFAEIIAAHEALLAALIARQP
jgi:hypothetical protein